MHQIRLARPEDAETIAALHVAAWRWAYRGLLPDATLDALDVVEKARQRRAALAKPGERRTWLVEDGGDVRGFLTTGPPRDPDLADLAGDGGAWELFELYLAADHVGHGLGRVLLERALEDAGDVGAAELVLWVLAGNERGHRFYARAGFARDERVGERGCVGDEGRAVRLRRDIGPERADPAAARRRC